MKTKSRNGFKLTVYLAIVFILPLLQIAIGISSEESPVGFIVFGIIAASPTIAAVITTLMSREFKTALLGLFQKNHLIRAIVLPILITCLTMVLSKLLFCVLSNVDFSLNVITGIQFVMIGWSLIAEEIGWRGFLEPLLKKMGVAEIIAPGIVGIVWSLWHYYLFLMGRIDVPLVWFFIGCIVESYIYSFLMNTTGNNIASAMIYHFMWNLMLHICAINPSDNSGNPWAYIILILLEIPVAIILYEAIKNRKMERKGNTIIKK